jgi:hypothetical protein
VKVRKLAGAVAAVAITFSFGAVTAAPAGAANNIKEFGQPEALEDAYGNPMITYIVHGLARDRTPCPTTAGCMQQM